MEGLQVVEENAPALMLTAACQRYMYRFMNGYEFKPDFFQYRAQNPLYLSRTNEIRSHTRGHTGSTSFDYGSIDGSEFDSR